jgi:hypothetical protein
VLRETDPQTTIWELLLPEEAKRLPTELARVDAYLDDERFIAPWRGLFSARLGRPRCRSTPAAAAVPQAPLRARPTRRSAEKSMRVSVMLRVP